MAAFGPPLPPTMLAAHTDAFERIDLPFDSGFGFGVTDGFCLGQFGEEGVAWRQYAHGLSRDTRIPTLDVGVNLLHGSFMSLKYAAKFVGAVLAAHHLYLHNHVISDADVLIEQHIYWVSKGLTTPDNIYLSKHNLNFVGSVDPSHIDDRVFQHIMAPMCEGGVADNALLNVMRSAVQDIDTTDLIRVVIHCRGIDCAGPEYAAFVQGFMDYVLFWGYGGPGKCRVELVFKGSEQHKANLVKLITTPFPGGNDQVNSMRQSNWKLHETAAWTADHEEDEIFHDGATFVPLHTRFGLRFEA